MTRVLNKVVVMGVVAIMLFSVFAFGAGHCVMYDPRVAELQRRIEEIEEENRLQAERVQELERENGVLRLEVHRVSAKLELREFVYGFDSYNYFDDDWDELMEHMREGLENIDSADGMVEIDAALGAAKAAIDGVLIRRRVVYSECGWFRSVVSVDRNRFNRWDHVEVTASLENLSGRDLYVHFNNRVGGPFFETPTDEIEDLIFSGLILVARIQTQGTFTSTIFEKNTKITATLSHVPRQWDRGYDFDDPLNNMGYIVGVIWHNILFVNNDKLQHPYMWGYTEIWQILQRFGRRIDKFNYIRLELY